MAFFPTKASESSNDIFEGYVENEQNHILWNSFPQDILILNKYRSSESWLMEEKSTRYYKHKDGTSHSGICWTTNCWRRKKYLGEVLACSVLVFTQLPRYLLFATIKDVLHFWLAFCSYIVRYAYSPSLAYRDTPYNVIRDIKVNFWSPLCPGVWAKSQSESIFCSS